jgi:PDZ domain-containing protein
MARHDHVAAAISWGQSSTPDSFETIQNATTDTAIANNAPVTTLITPSPAALATRRTGFGRRYSVVGISSNGITSGTRLRGSRRIALAVLRRPANTAAAMASPTIQAARVENSVTDTTERSVLTAPPAGPARPPSARQQLWAVPLLTVAGLIVLAVLGASAWPTRWIETAPGDAKTVADRLEIIDAQTFDSGELLFVTAGGAELTPLMAFVGWVDPVVDVHTCEQVGRCGVPRGQIRQRNLAAMSSAKQIAEYVALSRLGYEATLDPGPAQVNNDFTAAECPADSPADAACRVLAFGDTIIAVDGEPTPTIVELADAIAAHQPGDVVTLTVTPLDSVEPIDKQVALIADPNDASRTIVGFTPRDTRTVSVPVTVDVDTGDVGGPSAGLAFTLALIDALTPGSLTGDTTIAVTGTIDAEGNVGAIGSLPQKADAIRRAGASLFIVPVGQSDEDLVRAREIAGDGVQIVTVATLDEALQAIADHGGQQDPLAAAPS